MELPVRRHAAGELPNPAAVDGDEEDGLGVEHLERAAEHRLEDRLLRPPAIDQAGNFLEGGEKQFVACKVIRCRLHDFAGLGFHGEETNAISVPRFARYSSWMKSASCRRKRASAKRKTPAMAAGMYQYGFQPPGRPEAERTKAINSNRSAATTAPLISIVANRAARRSVQRNGFRGSAMYELVRPKGFEPLAFCSGGRRSIQLSYGRNGLAFYSFAWVLRSLGRAKTVDVPG